MKNALSFNKGKGKVPPGCLCFGEASHLDNQIFHAAGAKRFDTMPLSSILSQVHILCETQLLLTPRIICWKCTHFNLQTFACFSIDHIPNRTNSRIFPHWLSQVVMTWAQTCYLQIREPAF